MFRDSKLYVNFCMWSFPSDRLMHLSAVSAGGNHRMWLWGCLHWEHYVSESDCQPFFPGVTRHPGYCLLYVTQAPTPFACTCRQTSRWGYVAVWSRAKLFLWAKRVHCFAGCHGVGSYSESRSLPGVQTFAANLKFVIRPPSVFFAVVSIFNSMLSISCLSGFFHGSQYCCSVKKQLNVKESLNCRKLRQPKRSNCVMRLKNQRFLSTTRPY